MSSFILLFTNDSETPNALASSFDDFGLEQQSSMILDVVAFGGGIRDPSYRSSAFHTLGRLLVFQAGVLSV